MAFPLQRIVQCLLFWWPYHLFEKENLSEQTRKKKIQIKGEKENKRSGEKKYRIQGKIVLSKQKKKIVGIKGRKTGYRTEGEENYCRRAVSQKESTREGIFV